jgi:hypothetical protein
MPSRKGGFARGWVWASKAKGVTDEDQSAPRVDDFSSRVRVMPQAGRSAIRFP